jgi:hypothetical protein
MTSTPQFCYARSTTSTIQPSLVYNSRCFGIFGHIVFLWVDWDAYIFEKGKTIHLQLYKESIELLASMAWIEPIHPPLFLIESFFWLLCHIKRSRWCGSRALVRRPFDVPNDVSYKLPKSQFEILCIMSYKNGKSTDLSKVNSDYFQKLKIYHIVFCSPKLRDFALQFSMHVGYIID